MRKLGLTLPAQRHHAAAGFYASEDWVQANGHPRSAEEAAHLPFVGSDRSGQFLGYLRHDGRDCPEDRWAGSSAGRGAAGALPDLAGDAPRAAQLAADSGVFEALAEGLAEAR